MAFARAVPCGRLGEAGWPAGCVVQVVPCGAVPGLEFALVAAAQAYESRRRGVCVARRPEVDLLLRLMRTDRIDEAIARAGRAEGCCVVAGYGDRACAERAASLPEVPLPPGDWRLAVEESALVGARPSPCERVLDPEEVQHPADDRVNQVVHGPGPAVEPGGGGHYYGPRDRRPQHVLQVDRAQRRLPDEQHEPAPLLQVDHRRPREQVVLDPVGHGREGPHAARGHDHPLRDEAAAGEGGVEPILPVNTGSGQGVLQGDVQLVPRRQPGGVAHDGVHLVPHGQEGPDEPHPVDDAAGPAYPHHVPVHAPSGRGEVKRESNPLTLF